MTSVNDYSPFDPETMECPYPFYEAARREAPVYEVPGLGYFLVSRLRRRPRGPLRPGDVLLGTDPLTNDPPEQECTSLSTAGTASSAARA